ncbi:hypothetical protein PHMEG_00031660, partial [Phytophthora megakarya]
DSASDVHVCNQQDLLSKLKQDPSRLFQRYDGFISDNERVGNVQLRVANNKQPRQEVVLQLEKVLYKPSAAENLLSHDARENNGCTNKFGFCDSERVAWICKGRQQLLLKKSRGRYGFKTTVGAVYLIPAVQQRGSRNAEAPVVRWHLRFAHVNVPTLKNMARQEVAAGMSDGLQDDATMPCWRYKSAKMKRRR